MVFFYNLIIIYIYYLKRDLFYDCQYPSTVMKNQDHTQDKLRSIFRVAPTGIGFVKNRIIQEVNPRVCEMTGYSEEELIGQSSRLLYPTDEEYNYVGSEKYNQIARHGTGIVETRWKRKDGSIIYVLFSSTPIDIADLSQGVAFTALDFTERKQMQDALMKSEKNYRILVENQTDLVVKIDTRGRFTFVSPSYCSLFGKTEGELIGKNFMPLVHKDDRKATEEALKTLYSPPYTANLEQRAMTIKGWQWISWADTAIRDEQGNIVEIIGVGRNVTKKKKAEEKLEETKFGVDHAQIGVYQVEEDGTIKYANQYAAKCLGYTTAELTGKSLFDITPEFDITKFKQHRDITRKKTSRTIISTHRRKDGTEFPVEVTVNYFKYRDKLLSFSFVKDISERIQAEQTLLESESRFRTLAETAPVGIVISDKAGRNVYINQRFSELLGYSPEQITSVDDWYLLAYPDEHYREKVKKEWKRSLRSQIRGESNGQPMEYSVTCNNGSVKQIEFRFKAIGKLNFIFLIDNTERYSAEAAIRESERKLKEELEMQVNIKTQELQRRVHELERLQEATIGREFRIKELRDEIERLKGEKS